MKRIISIFSFVTAAVLMLCISGCSREVNNKIKELYGYGDIETAADSSDAESMADSYLGRDQQEKAKENANDIYVPYSEKNYSDYNKLFKTLDNMDGEKMPLAKRLLVYTYGAYGWFKQWAPYIGILSVVIGIFVFRFSCYNKGARRFALYGLIITVPVLLIFIVYGYAILIDIFMY